MKRLYLLALLLLCSLPALSYGFLYGTAVKTPNGYANIENLKTGDVVSSCNSRGCREAEVIDAGKIIADYIQITLSTGEQIGLSSVEKVIRVDDGKWTKAQLLQVGNKIATIGGSIEITAVRQVLKAQELRYVGLNIDHVFIVGEAEVLAHNVAIMVPLVAWGAGGLAFGPAAPIVWGVGAVVTIVGGIAMSEIAKHSNSPVHLGTVTGISTPFGTIPMETRGNNHFYPNANAEGGHSTIDPARPGDYETWRDKENRHPKDPHRWESEKRYDGGRSPHKHDDLPTPHIHENGKVRAAKPEEMRKL